MGVWLDGLPRRVRSGKCSALDNSGKRCQRQAWVVDRFHGNSEWMDPVAWVQVRWCKSHAGQMLDSADLARLDHRP